MLDRVLSFLKEQLNTYIQVKTEAQGFEVVYIQPRDQKEVALEKDAITCLLVNLEEDYTLRSGAAYEKMPPQSLNSRKNPNLYLNLYVLFAANFTDYSHSLQFLSLIIKFFQSHRLFDHQNSPTLSSDIAKLNLEMVNLPFSEQRVVWDALGLSYMPSVIYKVRMVFIVDEDTVEIDSALADKAVITSNI